MRSIRQSAVLITAGIVSFSAMAQGQGVGQPALSSPVNGAVNQSTAPAFSWGYASGASSYNIQVATISSFSSSIINQNVSNQSYTASGLANSTTYYWRVNGQSRYGGTTGSWSGVWSFTTVMPAPGAPVLASPTSGSVGQPLAESLNWGSAATAASYSVQVSTSQGFSATVFGQSGLGSPAATAIGLLDNMTYYWRADAANAGGTGGWSAVWSFSTLAGPPAAALLISPANVAINISLTPSLNWSAPAGATSYEVEIGTSSTFGTTVFDQAGMSAPGATANGLSVGTTYFWQVNASDSLGSNWSAIWSFTTIPAAPAVPVLTLPSNGAGSQPVSTALSWGSVATATSYSVQVSTDINFGTTVTGQTTSGATSATVNGLAYNAMYFWRASASNAGGAGGWSAAWSFTTIIAAPGAPAPLSPSNNAASQPLSVNLAWGTAAGATSYGVQVSQSRNSFYNTVFSQSGSTQTGATVSGLAYNTSYYWHVDAQNSGGTGTWSGTWTFTTTFAPPTQTLPLNAAVNQATSLTLSWSGTGYGTSASGYQVSTASDFSTTIAGGNGLVTNFYGGSGKDSAIVHGLTTGATYYWRASLTESGGTSWSNAWSFTTVVGTPALSSPSNGATVQSLTPTLAWTIAGTDSAFAVQVSTVSNFSSTIYSASGLASDTLTIGATGSGMTCYWRANASLSGATSPWSAAWSFTTILPTPPAPLLSVPLSGALNQPDSLTLSWGISATAISYELQVSTDAAFGSTVLDQPGLTGLIGAVSGLSSGTTYFWQVDASNAAGSSAWSSAWSFSTGAMQVVPLNAAWNLKSFNILPVNDSATIVFGPGADFLFVKDNAGNAYCPRLGENDIGLVLVGQGYQVYSSVPDTFRVQGTPVDYTITPITFGQGWNTIGYLPPTSDSIEHALAGVDSLMLLVKNNSGHTFWPALGIDGILIMNPGEGYKVLANGSGSFFYPAPDTGLSSKRIAGRNIQPVVHQPVTHHYAAHAITGNNATLLAKRVTIGSRAVRDSSEVGAFDAAGNLVGSGAVIRGITMVTIWGKNTRTKPKDGCLANEPVTFKLWDGSKEYPLDYETGNGTAANYAVDRVYLGALRVPEGTLINHFALTQAYPNPFRSSVKIAFDVPPIDGSAGQAIEINVYDMKGSLVKQLAGGKYAAGHYEIGWTCGESRADASGSGEYVIRMKAANFDKRLKVVKLGN
jgi:hypothetical protein